MENNKKKSLFSDRKFKYGSLAVGLTVAFVALIVIFNAVVYALAYSYGWYLDLTGEQYYGITDKSKAHLDGVLTEDVEIRIVFCQDKDRVLDDSAGYYVYKCAETYRKNYPDNIKIEFLDIITHPDWAETYTSQLGIPLYTNNVIFESNHESDKSEDDPLRKTFRIMTYDNFFTFDSSSGDVYAFNGERRFTSYIIGLCTDYPICYFTKGQGESLYDVDGEPNALWNLMIDAGFDVKEIDLETENIDGEARIVIINNPIYDLKASGDSDGEVNEIEKIAKFASEGGNVMVFISPEHRSNLPNLTQWLEEWGISMLDGQVRDDSHSLTVDGLSIVASYNTEGYAADFTLALRELDSAPSTIIKNAGAFKLLYEAQGYRETGVVLNSYTSSKLCTSNSSVAGSYPIAVVSRQTKVDSVTSVNVNNYVFATSAGYAEQSYIDSNAYGNRDALNYLISQMSRKVVPLDIDFKVFASEELSITTAEAYAWTVVLVGIIPLTVCGIGIFVCHKRKRL